MREENLVNEGVEREMRGKYERQIREENKESDGNNRGKRGERGR